MITENMSSLKIHKLTQDQYDAALSAGTLEEDAIYLTPDEDTGGSVSLDNVTGVLPIANGGTGASDAATARTNLGITPANIGAAAEDHTHDISGSSLSGVWVAGTATMTGTSAGAGTFTLKPPSGTVSSWTAVRFSWVSGNTSYLYQVSGMFYPVTIDFLSDNGYWPYPDNVATNVTVNTSNIKVSSVSAAACTKSGAVHTAFVEWMK